jgi:hypothetical protein
MILKFVNKRKEEVLYKEFNGKFKKEQVLAEKAMNYHRGHFDLDCFEYESMFGFNQPTEENDALNVITFRKEGEGEQDINVLYSKDVNIYVCSSIGKTIDKI